MPDLDYYIIKGYQVDLREFIAFLRDADEETLNRVFLESHHNRLPRETISEVVDLGAALEADPEDDDFLIPMSEVLIDRLKFLDFFPTQLIRLRGRPHKFKAAKTGILALGHTNEYILKWVWGSQGADYVLDTVDPAMTAEPADLRALMEERFPGVRLGEYQPKMRIQIS